MVRKAFKRFLRGPCVAPSLALLTLIAAGSLSAQTVSFLPRVDYAVGTNPRSVAVGDFNRDGILDLAVANRGTSPLFPDGNVSVLLGNANGTFQAAQSFAAGVGPTCVAVGDFNGDGFLDLAVGNGIQGGSGMGSVLLGNGNGTFQPPVSFSGIPGATVFSIAVGDFDGDGFLDLAAATDELAWMALGNGDGTFQPAVVLSVVGTFSSVAVDDFNGDTFLDLVVANDLFSGNVSVLLGNGDGTFQAARDFGAGDRPQSVAVGEFVVAGEKDLAVANLASNNVSVLLGNGDGTFRTARNFTAGSGPRFVAVGDFNGDLIQDLAVANLFSNNVSVLVSVGDGSFFAAQNFGAGSAPSSVAVGDFNGDLKPDLAVTNAFSNTVSVLINNTP